MSETIIQMPQTDATGLSENWLFRHCGEQHWLHLGSALGVRVEEIRDDDGYQLYPTFVAVRGRYTRPLNSISLDEHFHTAVEIKHFGRAFFNSAISFANETASFALEMLTAFVARDSKAHNRLHQSLPRASLSYRSESLASAPPLLKLSQGLRHREITSYEFFGSSFEPFAPGLSLSMIYEPSPYIDYNRAGLLYFASYPTIADTLERQIISQHRLAEPSPDWALQTSTIARDVFYYRNLDLGRKLRATLRSFEQSGEIVLTHTTLAADESDERLADVFTAKQVVRRD
jgi:probable biosynthetic protein (TIGR04098 family)